MQQRLPHRVQNRKFFGLIRDLMNHRIRLDDIVVSVETRRQTWRASKMRIYASFAIGAVALLVPFAASSHFLLLEPANLLVQNNRGDPQKAAPCGGTSEDKGTPSNAVTEVRGGDMLHIKITETVFHPGHYRAALAVNSLPSRPRSGNHHAREPTWSPFGLCEDRSEPEATGAGGRAVRHTERPAPGSFHETDIRLPNINCEKCTLQILFWMGEHALNRDGDYSYHHCASIKITANPALPNRYHLARTIAAQVDSIGLASPV